jgi:ABC-type transport system involved in cytochrome c biogenesis permease subunit
MVSLLVLLPLSLHAVEQKSFDMQDFARIPVLQDGRIKPLDSFARVMLKRIYGAPALPGESPDIWLASVLFTPQKAMKQPLFYIASPELMRILNLPPREGNLFSFEELLPVFASREALVKHIMGEDVKSLSGPERELTALYANVTDFGELAGSFSLLLPLPDVNADLLRSLGMQPTADLDYADTMRIHQEVHDEMQDVVERKHDDIDSYTQREQALAKFSYQLDAIDAMGRENALFRVIPPMWGGDDQWRAPWAVIEQGAGSPSSIALFTAWRKLAAAYRSGDTTDWSLDSAALRGAVAYSSGLRPWALTLETLYNRYNLIAKSLVLYSIGLCMAGWGAFRRSQGWLHGAYGVLLLGAGLHASALCMRMLILLRPPVSTLYESMIFVSFVAIAFGLWLERRRKGADGMIISAIVAALLLVAANVFAAGNDTLEVLVAVLNTNFWLATHVVCITTGYGSSLVAAALAHLYLVKRASRAVPAQTLLSLQTLLYRVAIVALLFTAVGTMLGGIWADQSWGRFWGWDPKENGALWIVLWLIWLLHGRLGGQLGEFGFAIGMAALSIVVALAWVGVNLLSVGLHSYGFTDTAADGLIGFCTLEIVFILSVTLVALLKKRNVYA